MADATDDRIHQLPRTTLFPEAPGLLQGLVDAGALAASWSGAGPALIRHGASGPGDAVRAGAEKALASRAFPVVVLALQAERRGIVYDDEAEVTL